MRENAAGVGAFAIERCLSAPDTQTLVRILQVNSGKVRLLGHARR